MYKLFFIILSCHLSFCLLGQASEYFVIDNIILDGNEHTVPQVIYNELDVTIGDTVWLKDLSTFKLENEKRILSTALFTSAQINIKNWDTESTTADVAIYLRENWYIYPSIIFELADRNFNVWWTEMNRDWSRVNYGVGLDHINLTGRKDKMKLKVQHGYTRKYELRYNYPYLTPEWGVFGEIFYANQREIGYQTVENKTLFLKEDDERILLQRFRTGGGVNYRPDAFQFHDMKVEYHHNQIDELIATEINPAYFLNEDTDLRYFALKYDYVFDRRIFNLYPEGGFMLFANLTKEGVGVFQDFNNFSVAAGIEKHFRLNDRLYYGGRIKVKANLIRNTVAFANNTGLGYGNDLVRGYELYVIDGTDWALAKSSLRYLLWEKNVDWGNYMLIEQFKKMSTRLFIRANLDFGFVNEPTYIQTNTLNNRMLIGYGPALDLLLFHTYKFSFEYSFNHIGESGLYLSGGFNF